MKVENLGKSHFNPCNSNIPVVYLNYCSLIVSDLASFFLDKDKSKQRLA